MDYSVFSEQDTMDKLRESLAQVAKMSQPEHFKAMSHCFPLAMTVRQHIFLNEDAMIFAELDALMNLTEFDDKAFYFIDFLGAPGGFVDFIYWKKMMHPRLRGWGVCVEDHDYHPCIRDRGAFEPLGTEFRSHGFLDDTYAQDLMMSVHEATESQGVHLFIANGV